ncbi:hypothetical protein [uncultured Muriicola sp.]|uniref:hypothetical protein n=1 Tax=uncultured Muriicola sp. TaxID=1583102 RepID=UPI002616A432|nr:hypothetical protein [uncultured Muriicola sp.]
MKHILIKMFFLSFLGLFLLPIGSTNLYAQETEKNRVRLKLDYIKIMGQESYLDIGAIAKIGTSMEDVPGLEMDVYYEWEGEELAVGKTTTNMNGKSKFILPALETIKADTSNTYTFGISFNGNDLFRKASKTVSIQDASIATDLITKDSINYIQATLTDIDTKLPLADRSLKVQVQRLIRPLRIGEEFNYTDETGTIIVPVEAGIPGLDGNLTLEVVLSDSDEYGTVKAVVDAPYGVPIIQDTSLEERALWGPRNKTPIFILIFTIFLILATWGPIVFLIRNLFKIYKS